MRMKPASRINATIEILGSEHRNRVPMDKVVGDYMRTRRYIGSKDRSDVAERVYNIVRAHARLGWWLEQNKAIDTPRTRVIAWLALGEQADEKRIADLFDGSKYAPEPLSENEQKLAQSLQGKTLEHNDMAEAVRAECPPEYEPGLRTLFGDDFLAEMQAMQENAPLDIRVNIFTADKEKVSGSLAKDGVEVEETKYCPWALRCKDKAYLSKTKAFNKGWIAIQDEGSQLIAWLCNAEPGMQVLDFCAGGGGKTLALAAAMQRKGRIVATDNDPRRLEQGRRRYKKAGIADIVEVRPLSEDRHRKWLKRQKGTFDIVLVDAPCTGSGTWRRNPDTRWSYIGPSMEELVEIQAEILEKAMRAVKPGGKLVYATCSLFTEENEAQIEKFLQNNTDFELIPLDENLNIGAPYMRLTPHRHGTDAFFTAILQRKTDEPTESAAE